MNSHPQAESEPELDGEDRMKQEVGNLSRTTPFRILATQLKRWYRD